MSAAVIRKRLEPGGYLNSQTTELSLGNKEDHQVRRKALAETGTSPGSDEFQCAICFFGLPRSYKEMVLPSIVKNVLEPNAKYNCDVFVHFDIKKLEPKGRMNPGGKLNATEIYDLQIAVEEVSIKAKPSLSSTPAVVFCNDTRRSFKAQRQGHIDKYMETMDKDGKQIYYPWKQKSWRRSSLVNLVKQWHSIDKVFWLMENHMNQTNKKYTRVAMLRNDAMYLSSIDILRLDNDGNSTKDVQSDIDVDNQHFVIPFFASFPVNDRMIYGPYDAVKIWATKRFDFLEERAKDNESRGYVMHSERFMESHIFPAMEKLGYMRNVHSGLCLVRTRPSSRALLNDCTLAGGAAKGFETATAAISEIESIVGRPCRRLKSEDAPKPTHHLLQC